MGTRSYIAKQIGDDQYLTIFCQLDGYPEETGATLVKYYDTPEKIDALLALGDLYCLKEKLVPDSGRHDFDAPQPGVTVAYQRDGDHSGWEATIKTFEELNEGDQDGVEYIYIYDSNGQWLYMPMNSEAGLRNVKEDLEAGTVHYSEPPDLSGFGLDLEGDEEELEQTSSQFRSSHPVPHWDHVRHETGDQESPGPGGPVAYQSGGAR